MNFPWKTQQETYLPRTLLNTFTLFHFKVFKIQESVYSASSFEKINIWRWMPMLLSPHSLLFLSILMCWELIVTLFKFKTLKGVSQSVSSCCSPPFKTFKRCCFQPSDQWNVFHTHLEAIVGPASKLHITVLVIKREPRDVDLTRGFENTRRYVGTASCVCHYHVGRKSPVKLFISTESEYFLFYFNLDDACCMCLLKPCFGCC